MKVRNLMSKTVHTCSPWTTLSEVGVIMFQHDCGVVPVVEDDHVIGMVTDRDICVAVATKGRRGDEIRTGEVIQGRQVFSCQADDEVNELIESMKAHRVRRVPVVDEDATYLAENLAESRMPAIPVTRDGSNPQDCQITHVITSSGFVTVMTTASGAWRRMISPADFAISVFFFSRSIRPMPGFRGNPAVTITTFDPARTAGSCDPVARPS